MVRQVDGETCGTKRGSPNLRCRPAESNQPTGRAVSCLQEYIVGRSAEEEKRGMNRNEDSVPRETRGRAKSMAIGAAGGALLFLIPTPPGLAYLLAAVVGGIAGLIVGSAFWTIPLRRRVSLFWLILSWGLVCGAVVFLVCAVPIFFWAYCTNPSLTGLGHSPPTGFAAAMIFVFLFGIPLSGIGFVCGAIMAPFMRRHEESGQNNGQPR